MCICIQATLIKLISQRESLLGVQNLQKQVEQNICQKLKYFFKISCKQIEFIDNGNSQIIKRTKNQSLSNDRMVI
ncbi:unnamed protein product [Paramecium octaurelia]|uniref:Uncharacterized protein n=1 Tax=Paramecium octaurelia TaxID=43137 RepID=A0A8S1V575_PAROT|nr:unnamed protein product [Paramecium octaurelia]